MINRKLQKVSFIVILILLLIFIPLTCYSIYLKIYYVKPNTEPENINKEMFFDGKLWFYSKTGDLLGTYTCQTKNCEYGKNSVEDDKYSLLYHKSEEESFLPIINDRFVFIKDANNETSKELRFLDLEQPNNYKDLRYSSVKNYNVGLENNLYIIENQEQKYGILQINAMPMSLVPCTYDFIGVVDNLNDDGMLISDHFVALKENEWMIIDSSNAKLTKDIEDEIVTFNGTYIITKNENDLTHVVNYNNESVLNGDYISLDFVGKYLLCQTENAIYLYDLVHNEIVSEEHTITDKDTFKAEINDSNIIEIYINDEVVERV